MASYALLTTTINVPNLLLDYAKCATEIYAELSAALESALFLNEQDHARLAKSFAGYRVWTSLPILD